METSALPLAVVLVSVEVEAVAPVVLVESLVAPMVLLEELGDVLDEDELGVVLLMLEPVSLERDVVSDELVAAVSLEVELLGEVLAVLLLELGYVLLLGDVLLAVEDESDDVEGEVLLEDDDGEVLLVVGVVLVLP